MKLNNKTLERLKIIINEDCVYRSGPMLVNFFNELGFNDEYGQGFPSRWKYTADKLKLINDTPLIEQCILKVFNPQEYIGYEDKLFDLVTDFNKYLAFDGVKINFGNEGLFFEKTKYNFQEALKQTCYSKSLLSNSETSDEKRKFLSIKVDNLKELLADLPLDLDLKLIIEERLEEIQKCIKNEIPLSAIFLCGSVLEGVLFSLAQKNPQLFNQAKASPKIKNSNTTKTFSEWTLKDFIDVSYELDFIKLDVKKFSKIVQDFRNYIHPRQQLNSKFNPDINTAVLCSQVVKIALKQISEKVNTQNEFKLGSK